MIFLVLVIPCFAQEKTEKALTQKDFELMKLQIKSELNNEGLNEKTLNELHAHRIYLQELDDRLFKRFTWWVSIASGAIVIIVGLFSVLSNMGIMKSLEQTKKDATIQARNKIEETITSEYILHEFQVRQAEITTEIANLQEKMLKEAKNELEEAKKQIVSNKQEIIEQTLSKELKEKFSEPLDVLKRISELEAEVSRLQDIVIKIDINLLEMENTLSVHIKSTGMHNVEKIGLDPQRGLRTKLSDLAKRKVSLHPKDFSD